jgi:hypothetical protein
MVHPSPPLMYTQHSLLSMLLNVFQLEFPEAPDSLPRQEVAQMLQDLPHISTEKAS